MTRNAFNCVLPAKLWMSVKFDQFDGWVEAQLRVAGHAEASADGVNRAKWLGSSRR